MKLYLLSIIDTSRLKLGTYCGIIYSIVFANYNMKLIQVQKKNADLCGIILYYRLKFSTVLNWLLQIVVFVNNFKLFDFRVYSTNKVTQIRLDVTTI